MRLVSRRTIVVVESSTAVQELVDHSLREVGHRVFVTRDPIEALELGYRVRIDLLVCGGATFERTGILDDLRSVQPSLPVLYLADRGYEGLVENAAALKAPFSLDELQDAVAAALERGPGSG